MRRFVLSINTGLEELLVRYINQNDECNTPTMIVLPKTDNAESPEQTSTEQESIPEPIITHDIPTLSKREQLAKLYYEAQNCNSCQLSQSRSKMVFGSGNAEASIMVIGEAPGYQEDQQGLPFVGPAGQLLTKMLAAINIDRNKDVFIANVLKCRPPGNRTPSTEESTTCISILRRQINIIQPKAILLLGRVAANNVLNNTDPISRMRQGFHSYMDTPVKVTYHPAALLRNQNLKKDTWLDLQEFQKRVQEL